MAEDLKNESHTTIENEQEAPVEEEKKVTTGGKKERSTVSIHIAADDEEEEKPAETQETQQEEPTEDAQEKPEESGIKEQTEAGPDLLTRLRGKSFGKVKLSEPVYGNCEGPDAMYIKLIANDGHEFIVKRHLTSASATIRAMLNNAGRLLPTDTNEIHFMEIRSDVMAKICQYLVFLPEKIKAIENKPAEPIAKRGEDLQEEVEDPDDIPQFLRDNRNVLEVLFGAYFLQC